ncbi:MAG TPA: type II secretion system protein GspL [Myxococcota bacterium]|jgi:type IV pilus assembly protein PilM|nr:type II secretion system protein GspL [Myxococcota bacterium]
MDLQLRRVLGLDLGSHTVKAVELRQTLRGIEIGQLRALPREGEAPGVDAPSADEAPDEALARRLRQLVALHQLPTDPVVTALASDRVTSRRLSFPFRDRRRLAQAVPFEVEAELPFALEDVLVDWEILGGDRTRADVLVLVAPRAEVSATLERLRAVGLEPRILEAEGHALGNLVALFPQPGVRLFADVGHRKTTLALAAEGRILAIRAVPLGGLHLTRALAAERGIPFEQAERAKCEQGLLARRGSAGELECSSPAARGVLERLALEIVRTIGASEPALAPLGTALESVVLLGGTARLPHLDAFLAERTGFPAQRFAFPPGAAGSALVAGGDPLLFAPAVALALRGSLQARTRTDFRREEFAWRRDLSGIGREFRSTAWLAALAAGLGVILLGTSYLSQSVRVRGLDAQLASVYSAAFPGQPVPGDPVAAMREAVRSAHERADALGVYRGNLSALDLLTEISARVPQDLEVVFEELAIDRQVVRIRGFTKSFEAVDRLRSELSGFEPFSEIQVSEIKDDAKRGGKSFSVTISLAKRGEDA